MKFNYLLYFLKFDLSMLNIKYCDDYVDDCCNGVI